MSPNERIYVGCMNWSHPDLPHASVIFRVQSVHFDTWAEAISYADRLARAIRTGMWLR